MDWSRAKNILLFIFIILNIFLLVNISIYYYNGSDTVKSVSNAEKVLKDRGYILECSIPKTVQSSAQINYELTELDKGKILRKLFIDMSNVKVEKQNTFYNEKEKKRIQFGLSSGFSYDDSEPDAKLNLKDKSKTEKYARDFLKKLDLGISELYLDDTLENSDGTITYVFCEKYKDYVLYSTYIDITVSEKGVTNILCGLMKVNSLTYTDVKIVPAYQILLKNFRKGNDTVIKSIDLGFRGQYIAGAKTDFSETLVWRVKLGEGDPQHFSVTDGSPISSTDSSLK